ncbi:MAG: DNA mismatch repair protein MutS [Firmicutes bacterium]|nr:DNA mismatch repair protein MutS [Bacillota bacterium]
MRKHTAAIEFDTILARLGDHCLCEKAKEKALALAPSMNETELRARLAETTAARRIIEALGTPPLSPTSETRKTLTLCEAGAMLTPGQLAGITRFVRTCNRMKSYLQRAEITETAVAALGRSLHPLKDLYEEIDGAIRGDTVDDQASPELRAIRRKMESARDAVKSSLESMLRGKREWFSESFIVTRGGRFALPVKREHKQQVQGTVVDISNSGSTVFIEPTRARKLSDALMELAIREDNEIRRILYTLTALAEACHKELLLNVECMEALDFAFAKAKLSLAMKAGAPDITAERRITIVQGRHPMLDPDACVPLDFTLGEGIHGVVITGPNTGGKTVALKTLGLLSLMAQSGLHVPAGAGSRFAMNASVLCDIGDGQSIAENLSTFSSHMTNIIKILREAAGESLVLLDELGSGTDPAEGMGLAVAILDELRRTGCLFAATSHYPEIKEYAAQTQGLQNARMAFDRESLAPLYRLELGEAGESCALYIAQRLGLPAHMLARAREAAYHGALASTSPAEARAPARRVVIRQAPEKPSPRRCDRFQVGDSVRVHPRKETGIVYRRADEKGMVGVQVKKQKLLVNHKRIQLLVAADALYPDDYDFSILFDTVANRKARHKLSKGHNPDVMIQYEKGGDPLGTH